MERSGLYAENACWIHFSKAYSNSVFQLISGMVVLKKSPDGRNFLSMKIERKIENKIRLKSMPKL